MSAHWTSVHLSRQEGEREERKLHMPDVGDNEHVLDLSYSADLEVLELISKGGSQIYCQQRSTIVVQFTSKELYTKY